MGTCEEENYNQCDLETQTVKKVVNMLPEIVGDRIQSPESLLCFFAHNHMRSKTECSDTKVLSRTVSYLQEWVKMHT